jgi:hypothetical protein
MKRVPLPEHSKRFEYVLTEKGREFFPAYLALKKWGDTWLAEPKGPQVVFIDKATGREVDYGSPRSSAGEPLKPEHVKVIAGSGAVPFNQKRFGAARDGLAASGTGSSTSKKRQAETRRK